MAQMWATVTPQLEANTETEDPPVCPGYSGEVFRLSGLASFWRGPERRTYVQVLWAEYHAFGTKSPANRSGGKRPANVLRKNSRRRPARASIAGRGRSLGELG